MFKEFKICLKNLNYILIIMSKLIYDPIHGYIEISKICLKIIDTPEFQRLRNIKQLGACEYVFPSATHNRFSHSLGVYYLAGKLIRIIKNNQPELQISNEDIECIEIAGLCHDLGHGPFSHCFDNHCINHLDNKLKHHEARSCEILRFICNKYNININLKKINDIIIPPKNNKHFIYSIVCNEISGIDVDKFDYIVRDTYFIGLEYSFDFNRIFKLCKVINNELCYSDKLVLNIYELFRVRYRLYKEIYNHPVVSAIEFMIADILKKKNINISNISDFCKIDDSIVNNNELIKKLHNRNIYKLKYEKIYMKKFPDTYPEINDNEIIHKLKIGLNNKNVNPIDNITFYNNNKIIKINTENVSYLIADIYTEFIIRIYSKN